jgi:hypothetical protein
MVKASGIVHSHDFHKENQGLEIPLKDKFSIKNQPVDYNKKIPSYSKGSFWLVRNVKAKWSLAKSIFV